MDFERPVAHFVALFGKISKILWRVQSAVFIAMQCRRVRGKWLFLTAEQPVKRFIVQLAGDVPQADVDKANAEHRPVPESAFRVVVYRFPGECVLADQVVGNLLDIQETRSVGRIFTNDALVGVNLQDRPALFQLRPGLVDHVESVVVLANVF